MFNITLTLLGTLFPPPYPNLARIHNGVQTQLIEYPYIVSIVLMELKNNKKTYRACTGSAISPHWVLTCAHTMKKKFDTAFIQYRNWKLSDKIITKDVQKIAISPKYSLKDDVLSTDDIALLRIDKIHLKEYGKLSKFDDINLRNGQKLLYAGFGLHNETNTNWHREPLRIAKGIVRNCPDLEHEYFGRFICLDPVNANSNSPEHQHSLEGDSGGPLFYEGYIIGVLAGCPQGRSSNVTEFTPVIDHLEWIKRTTKLTVID